MYPLLLKMSLSDDGLLGTYWVQTKKKLFVEYLFWWYLRWLLRFYFVWFRCSYCRLLNYFKHTATWRRRLWTNLGGVVFDCVFPRSPDVQKTTVTITADIVRFVVAHDLGSFDKVHLESPRTIIRLDDGSRVHNGGVVLEVLVAVVAFDLGRGVVGGLRVLQGGHAFPVSDAAFFGKGWIASSHMLSRYRYPQPRRPWRFLVSAAAGVTFVWWGCWTMVLTLVLLSRRYRQWRTGGRVQTPQKFNC